MIGQTVIFFRQSAWYSPSCMKVKLDRPLSSPALGLFSRHKPKNAPHSLFQIISLIEPRKKSIRSGSIFHDPAVSGSICIAYSVIRKSRLSHCIFFFSFCTFCCPTLSSDRMSVLGALELAVFSAFHRQTVKSFLKIDRKYQMNVSELWRAAWSPVVWATTDSVFCSSPPWLRMKWISPSGWLHQSLQQGNFHSEALECSNCGAHGVLLLEGYKDS